MNDERAGHAGLDDQTVFTEVDHRVLGSAKDVVHSGARQLTEETAARHAAQHVVMTQADSPESAAKQGRADVADDGFDFGKLGHRCKI
jgi:hypothetical protein